MSARLTTTQLLAHSESMVDRCDPEFAGVWPLAGSILARQALEHTIDILWRGVEPSLASASMRAKLLCLPDALGDPALAREADYAWWALSEACHHRAYEVGPTAEELRAQIEVVRRLIGAVRGVLAEALNTEPVARDRARVAGVRATTT